ncbi:MAG: 3-oxo-5-alpha-steroid 4-dehydrogenase [Gemmatimonadota bacterium]|nr:3-oxo-5-alpha-steroid 4-dehydrogenase [Gemmatimonadota bacterium]
MTDVFTRVVFVWTAIGAATFVLLLKVRAPYGRYLRPGWGPTLPHRVGWIAMEIVSPAALVAAWLSGSGGREVWAVLFVVLWLAHYLNRALVFPFVSRWGGRRMPVAIMASAIVFNAVNGGLNGWWFGHIAAPYPDGWATDPRFVIGLSLFVCGATINIRADATLRGLRAPGESGYRIPRGGLYRFVSCPNYLGEIVEWVGFAVLAWSPAAATFAVWTAANLTPRALSHHAWYRETFDDYPEKRRALIPGIL